MPFALVGNVEILTSFTILCYVLEDELACSVYCSFHGMSSESEATEKLCNCSVTVFC